MVTLISCEDRRTRGCQVALAHLICRGCAAESGRFFFNDLIMGFSHGWSYGGFCCFWYVGGYGGFYGGFYGDVDRTCGHFPCYPLPLLTDEWFSWMLVCATLMDKYDILQKKCIYTYIYIFKISNDYYVCQCRKKMLGKHGFFFDRGNKKYGSNSNSNLKACEDHHQKKSA